MRAWLVAVLLLCATTSAPAQSLKDRLKKAAEKAKATATKVDKAGMKADSFAAKVSVLLPISTTKEIDIGRGVAATVAGRYPISTDSTLNAYVNMVGQVVAAEAPRPDINYLFAVLETADVNAFAAPGGYIFITRGALDLIDSESELAGVLAHEVAHVNKRHVVDQIRQSDVLRGIQEETGIKGEKLLQVVGAGANVLFTGLSRGDEEESDSLGVEYAAGAGYDPKGLSNFINRLAQRSQDSKLLDKLSDLIATHPAASERIDKLDRIAENLTSEGAQLKERYRRFVSLKK
jgi:beta-barrel assembly-enhancing protease